MAVFIDVKSRFDDASGRKAAEEAKRYFDNAGTSAGDGFTSNFAKAVEKDTKVRAAADKVANSLDKITAAEAKRATQLERSKAVSEAVAAAEDKLNGARESGDVDAITAAEEKLTSLRSKQVEVDNKLVVSSSAVSRAERDRARAVREASDAYKSIGDDVESLGSKLAKLGSVGGALKLNLGLAALGTLPAAATAITEVAGALQQLAGAGFAVPGIFAGIASSVGVGALGMYGMSDAIKAVDKASDGTKASVEAANEALAKLPASSADVVRTVVGLKGTFSDLQNIASTNMFAGVSDGLKGLVAADLPVVTRGIDGISRSINGNLRTAMTSLGSSSSQGFLKRIFGNTADAQSLLSAAIDPAVHAIGTLAAAGSDSLPRLATAVGDVADRFNSFITGADADGRLAKWIDEGLTGFTQLGNAALNIGRVFTGLTEAAGGGTGLLGTLESATGRMATFVNSTAGQNKLREFFAEGRDMLSQLKDVASSSGPVLAGVFRAGVDAANIYLPVIKSILDTINRIPGGAAAVVGAFTAWKTIAGVASLASSLSNIVKILEIAMPGAAAKGAAGITTAFAGIKLPAWLSSFLAAGGSIAALPAAVAGFATVGNSMLENAPNSAENARARGAGGLATGGAGAHGVRPTDPTDPMAGGGVNMSRPLGVPTLPKGPTVWGFVPPPGSPAAAATPGPGGVGSGSNLGLATPAPTPGVSSYTDPVITETDKGAGGKEATPFVDPSKFSMGDPLAGLPGAAPGADPAAIYAADSKVISAAHNVEQQRLANQVLEAKGNATQAEILAAKFDLQEKERALYNAQADDVKARTNQMKQATSDLKDVFAPLDSDFGISKGLPGIVENLMKALGDFALGGAIRSSPSLQAGAAQLEASGGVAPGLFNQQYFNADGSVKATSVAGSNAANSAAIGQQFFGNGSGASGAYPGDAALLANVPRGSYDNGPGDLTKGIADCSSAVEDLVNIMDGRPTAGRNMATGNEAEWLTAHGFQQGMGGPGDFRVGFNGGHTQATLPGGTPFNWGSDSAAARGGVGGTGADDPAFTSHFFRPAGASPSALGPASWQPGSSPTGAGAPSSSGFGNLPVPLPVTIVGGLGGDPFLGAPGAGGIPGAGGAGIPGAPDIFGPSMAGPGTNSPAPGAGGSGWGIPGLPSIPAGAGGQGYGIGAPAPGAAGAGAGQPIGGTGVSAAATPGGGGLGAGGDLMAAAGMAADIALPGSSLALKVANRTIQYGAQAAAIGVSGALETWLPAGSPLAANSWFSKLAGGLSGAKAAKPNTAGGQGGQPQQAPPMGSPASGNGAGPAPGPAGDTNITVNNQRATEDGTGRDIAFHQQAMNSGPGH